MSEPHIVAGPDLTPAELYALLKLRVDTFVVEQRCVYPELDGLDLAPDTLHLWLQPPDAQAPVACLRILGGPVPRIGRVCTARQSRGQGHAAVLMAAAVDRIGAAESVLHAQVQAQTLYTRFGYVPEGDPFDDDGIMHIAMRRPAHPQAASPTFPTQ